jgi:hypothetical protein
MAVGALAWLRLTARDGADCRSADKLVVGVYVGAGAPEFHHLAVTQMEDMRFVDLDAPAAPTGAKHHQRDAVLIVGEDCMKVGAEGSLRDLHELAEELVDGLPTAVLTRCLIPPGIVPQQVFGEQIIESGGIALGESGVPRVLAILGGAKQGVKTARWRPLTWNRRLGKAGAEQEQFEWCVRWACCGPESQPRPDHR